MNVHRIPLTHGREAIVDGADADLVARYHWCISGPGYVYGPDGLLLHRLIMGAGPDDPMVDHANHDPLDNRRANLRFATKSQNGANRHGDRRKRGTTSRYKGVSWDRRKRRWFASIHIDGRTRSLGRHATEEAAARAYNAAAVEAWGEFARLNVVPEQEGSAAGG